jgi:hypothetical protein
MLTKLLFLYHQKDGISQFPVFYKIIQVVQQFQALGPAFSGTDGVKDSVLHNDGQELLNQQQKK